MFAVKGWNVDAGQLRQQTELFKAASADLLQGGKQADTSSRKRKRDRKDHERNESGHTTDKQPTIAKKQKEQSDKSSKTRDPPQHEPSASTSKKPKKAKTRHADDDTTGKTSSKKSTAAPTTKNISKTSTTSALAKLTPMQAAMRQKLVSARFRHLNETLYTAPSRQAQDLFDSNPDMFEDYHAGFRQQVAVWPENPVDKMIQKIRQRGKARMPDQKRAFKTAVADTTGALALPRTQGLCTIADCGCGDARLAQTIQSSNDSRKLNVKVLSYDLHSPSDLVTKADISSLPLGDGSANVVIFCLALMGTNWISFIEEAYRVLHWKGELWVAEIKSRFARVGRHGRVVEHSVGNRRKQTAVTKANTLKRQEQEETLQEETLQTEVDGVAKTTQETDVQGFVDALKRRGFLLKDDTASIDLSNKMFVSMEFIKAAAPTKGKGYVEQPAAVGTKKRFISAPTVAEVTTEDEAKTLKPCLYKIR